jgi:HAD superfamily hydrolase (TIGR01490 family)
VASSGHPERPVLAVFDFDGTLTSRDSSLPFLAFAAGAGRVAASLLVRGPLLLADLTVAARAALRADDGPAAPHERWKLAVHERLLRALFRGRSRAELAELGRRFAGEALDPMLAPGALDQVRWHLDNGHRCLLVTGSLDAYMEPWGARAGFERVLATRVAHDGGERVLGGFDGGACWGAAKLDRLRDAVGDLARYTLVVYGNEPSDRPLLEAADHPVRVRPGDSWPRLSAAVREALA